MLLNKKILIVSVLLLIILPTSWAADAQVCETGKIKEVLRKILYLHFTEGIGNITREEMKDLLVFYLRISSQNLTVDCSAMGSRSNKQIFEVMLAGDNLPDRIPSCHDGTKYGHCSANKPGYCYAGSLYLKCDLCGCPVNSKCGKSGKCESLSQNITCFYDIDCGQSGFAGDYFCYNSYIMRNYINYSCHAPGTASSRCVSATNPVYLTYCNPLSNLKCEAGKATCQSTNYSQANASTCFVKIDGVVVKSVYATDRYDCYNKTSFGSINCRTYAPYFTDGVHFLEQYFGAYDRVNNEYCTCANGVCVQGNQTAQSVTLHSLTINGSSLEAVYSKNFDTCVHLLTSANSITHTQNYFCTQGSYIKTAAPLSGFNVTAGQTYKLCHGNNYNICSSLVAVKSANLTSFDTITIKGRYVDKFSGNPIPNIGIWLVKSPTERLGTFYANTNGEFAVTTSTTDITQSVSKVLFHFGTCHMGDNGVAIARYPTTGYLTEFPSYQPNAIYVWTNNFDLSKTGKYFSVTSAEVNVGDVPLWASADISVSSDIAVSMSIAYPEEGRASGVGCCSTSLYSRAVVPLNYDAKVELKDASGNVYTSPTTNAPLSIGCGPVGLTFLSKQFSWNTTQTTTCVDYDNGDNIYVASYAKKGTQAQYDKCGTSGQNYDIIEGVCTNGQLSGIPHSCPTGTKCQNIRYEPAVYANVSACVNVTTTNQTTLQAPSNIIAGWGITNDNTKKSSLYFHAINFGYADPVPAAFRVYLKKPGESASSLAAEFKDLSAPCETVTTTGGSTLSTGWSIYRRCNSNNWKIESYWLPTTGYPQGIYRFYLTAVDAFGKESTSPQFEMHNLQPLTVSSPTSTQSPVASNPTFQWSVSSGWSKSPAPYAISIYDDAKFGEPWRVHSASVNVPTTSTTGSYVYDGPALDPSKKYVVRIYGLSRAYPTGLCPSCDYISMDTSTQTFWVSSNQPNQTCTDSDGGNNLSVKGTTTVGIDSVADYCTGNYVTEGWCSYDVRYQASYLCPNGCGNGACLNQTATNQTNASFKCTDSDNGISYYLYGTTNGYKAYWDRIQANIVTEKDSCTTVCSGSVGSGIGSTGQCLIEYHCDSADYAAFTVYQCPNGCQNGVCINQTSQTTNQTNTSKPSSVTLEGSDGTWCYDPDGYGYVDIKNKKYCQDNTGIHDDYCESSTLLRDWYCGGTWNGVSWSNVKCWAGGYTCSCSNGACP